MRSLRTPALAPYLAIVVVSCGLVACGPEPSARGAEAGAPGENDAIVALERERLQALARGDAATLERVLDDTCVVTFADGVVRDKRAIIAAVLGAPDALAGVAQRPDDVRARFYGDVAVAAGTVVITRKGADGEKQTRARFTDVWVRRGAAWRAVAIHVNDAR